MFNHLFFIFKNRFLLKHNYFPYFKAFANTPLEELEENQAFRNHANNIIQALDNVILNLEDELTIQRELTALGKMHGKKKISEQQFQVRNPKTQKPPPPPQKKKKRRFSNTNKQRRKIYISMSVTSCDVT